MHMLLSKQPNVYILGQILMSVKQVSIHVIRMRFVTITWDHTTAAAVLGTLEMDKRVSVIVKFLLIGCYYFLILFTKRCQKRKKKKK